MPMNETSKIPLASVLAAGLRDSRLQLTGRWLERLVARVDVAPNRVFPTDELLDHMPLLILGIADHLEEPSRPILARSDVVDRAMELGALRHGQGFDEYEVMKEFEILGGIVFTYLTESLSSNEVTYSADEVLACAGRVFQAMALIQQAAVSHYVRLMKIRVAEREDRLRGFNRALTHEFRNRIGAALGASQILDLANLDEGDRSRLTRVIADNMDSMRIVLDNLLELTALDFGPRQHRHVRLPEVVQEVVRHVRDMARARGVAIEFEADMADVEVPAAAVELCLTNLISNAIKYADATERERWVRVASRVAADDTGVPCEVVVTVSDNGIGVPVEQRDSLFRRLFRATNAESSGAEGTGLGLSIVRETMESLGGRVSAEFPGKGSVFTFSFPCRRAGDLTARESDLPNEASSIRT
jgi:signal transduction histidine kinase